MSLDRNGIYTGNALGLWKLKQLGGGLVILGTGCYTNPSAERETRRWCAALNGETEDDECWEDGEEDEENERAGVDGKDKYTARSAMHTSARIVTGDEERRVVEVAQLSDGDDDEKNLIAAHICSSVLGGPDLSLRAAGDIMRATIADEVKVSANSGSVAAQTCH